MEGTSSRKLQRRVRFPPLLLLVTSNSSLGFIMSSEERPGSLFRREVPVLPVSAAGPSDEKQPKTPNTTLGNEAVGGEEQFFKRAKDLWAASPQDLTHRSKS